MTDAAGSPNIRLGSKADTNTPVLGDDGYVRWIINSAEDVTELMKLRATVSAAAKPAGSLVS